MRQFELLNELSVEIRELYRLRNQILRDFGPEDAILLERLRQEIADASELRFRIQEWLVRVARVLGMEDF